jgi:type II secretory pathway component PulJ
MFICLTVWLRRELPSRCKDTRRLELNPEHYPRPLTQNPKAGHLWNNCTLPMKTKVYNKRERKFTNVTGIGTAAESSWVNKLDASGFTDIWLQRTTSRKCNHVSYHELRWNIPLLTLHPTHSKFQYDRHCWLRTARQPVEWSSTSLLRPIGSKHKYYSGRTILHQLDCWQVIDRRGKNGSNVNSVKNKVWNTTFTQVKSNLQQYTQSSERYCQRPKKKCLSSRKLSVLIRHQPYTIRNVKLEWWWTVRKLTRKRFMGWFPTYPHGIYGL